MGPHRVPILFEIFMCYRRQMNIYVSKLATPNSITDPHDEINEVDRLGYSGCQSILIESSQDATRVEQQRSNQDGSKADSPVELRRLTEDDLFIDPAFGCMNWRWDIWCQLLEIIFDIPFIPLSLIVTVTIWRFPKLYNSVSRLIKRLLESFNESEINRTALNVRPKTGFEYDTSINFEIRWVITKQFLCILRDILTLIPFTIVIGTLYRLPTLVLNILEKLSGKPIDRKPLIRPSEVFLAFPERGGKPPNLNIYISIKIISIIYIHTCIYAFKYIYTVYYSLICEFSFSRLRHIQKVRPFV